MCGILSDKSPKLLELVDGVPLGNYLVCVSPIVGTEHDIESAFGEIILSVFRGGVKLRLILFLSLSFVLSSNDVQLKGVHGSLFSIYKRISEIGSSASSVDLIRTPNEQVCTFFYFFFFSPSLQ